MSRGVYAVRKFQRRSWQWCMAASGGGACDLIMNCDIVLRDETCAFAVTPAKLGLPYNVSGIQHFVNGLPLNIVKEMFFSADPITAVRVEQVGIVNRLVAAKKLEQATRALGANIASRSPHANAAF